MFPLIEIERYLYLVKDLKFEVKTQGNRRKGSLSRWRCLSNENFVLGEGKQPGLCAFWFLIYCTLEDRSLSGKRLNGSRSQNGKDGIPVRLC